MIIVIDALNKHEYGEILDQMFQLRARVFADRLGWDVEVKDGKEIDQFDALDPAYVVGVDDEGHVVSCVRALQTTGPHMLADVFSDILDGEPPLRSATVWESTRFCVDTNRLSLGGRGPKTVSHATAELMIGALEYARDSGIKDIITVIDPVMNRVLKRSDNAPYDYVGKTTPMGKVSAMAALLDCSDERINRVRAFADITYDVFGTEAERAKLKDADAPAAKLDPHPAFAMLDEAQSAPPELDMIADYLRVQLADSTSPSEYEAAKALMDQLSRSKQFSGLDRLLAQSLH